MGSATHLLVAPIRNRSLIGIVLGVVINIQIILKFGLVVDVVLPPAMDQSKCISSQILSRL
jgi:hypothetical protein